ncbi:Golgi-associated kinase 1B, partial [Frankliniella fusca]
FVVLGWAGTSLHSTKEGRWLGGSLTRPPRDLTRVHYREMAPLAHETNLTIYFTRTKCYTAEMTVKTGVSDPRKSFPKEVQSVGKNMDS